MQHIQTEVFRKTVSGPTEPDSQDASSVNPFAKPKEIVHVKLFPMQL